MTTHSIIPLPNVIDTTENCRYCLMCRHVCPVGHVMKHESMTPHGWGLTIASVKRGLLEWNDSSINVLYSCADCGTCREHCVTDQPLPEAIAAARAEVAAQNLAPAAVYDLEQKLRTYSTPYAEQMPEPANGAGNVALFVGDEARYLTPNLIDAVVTLLRAAGLDPVLVGVGRSNGYLASSIGFPTLAAELVCLTFDEVKASGASRLLVLSAGDRFAFTQLAPERLGVLTPDGVEVVEVLDMLARALDAGAIKFNPSNEASEAAPTAYVDPTHGVRMPDERHIPPRTLLNAIYPQPLVELFWRQGRTHPVGSTALQFTQPAIARHLTYARLGDAAQVGARRLVTEDPGTYYHLSQFAGRFGLTVQNLYELLAASLAS